VGHVHPTRTGLRIGHLGLRDGRWQTREQTVP
jgi:hypothetical protein